jgi:putative ABC transport system permease protein
MKWLPLVWAALRRKPARSILTVLSLTIAFLLVGVMTGVNASVAQMLERAPVDRILVIFRFGAWQPITHVEQIGRLDGVTDVAFTARLEGTYQRPENFILIETTDERLLDVQPELNLTPELFDRLEMVRNGLLISQSVADRLAWRAGETYPLETDRVTQDGSRTWTVNVVAIVPDVESRPGGFAFGNFAYLNEGRNDGRRNDVHVISLRVADASRAGEISNAIEALFTNSPAPVVAMPERAMMENNLQFALDLEFVTYAISAAALVMILFLTGNVLAQSVRERIPEFGAMKAVGFTDRAILLLVLTEAAVLCLAGAALGLAATAAAPIIAAFVLPGAPEPVITMGVAAIALVSAVLVAAASGIPAVWRIRRLTIAEALGGR